MAEMDKYKHSHFISANINALISFPSETAVREDLTQKVNLSLMHSECLYSSESLKSAFINVIKLAESTNI